MGHLILNRDNDLATCLLLFAVRLLEQQLAALDPEVAQAASYWRTPYGQVNGKN